MSDKWWFFFSATVAVAFAFVARSSTGLTALFETTCALLNAFSAGIFLADAARKGRS